MDSHSEQPSDREIITRVYTITSPPSNLNIELSFNTTHDIDEIPGLEVVVEDQSNGGKQIASMKAYVFYRDEWDPTDFFQNMDLVCQEACDLAKELFDRVGRLKKNTSIIHEALVRFQTANWIAAQLCSLTELKSLRTYAARELAHKCAS